MAATLVACSGSSASPKATSSPSLTPRAGSTFGGQAALRPAASACRGGDPLANVYHPARLGLVRACQTVTGSVRLVEYEEDGDVHFNIALDPPFTHLLNRGNVADQRGQLVAEIVPADEPSCTKGRPPYVPSIHNFGVCTGANIVSPGVGSHVSVTGPYVYDRQHGWMEIHPVWQIVTLRRSPAPGSSVASDLRITSISPDPVSPGQNITLVAQTLPFADCSITVTYASGRVSGASGLGSTDADANGSVSWTWRVGTSTQSGIATVGLSCDSMDAKRTFRVT